jgi:hypothetical protein
MAHETPTLSQMVAELPRQLQRRFESLGSYVKDVLERDQGPGGGGLSRDHLAAIQLAAFVYSLREFLEEGTRAARSAAIVFESLGATRFRIGRTEFSRNNENTLLGRRLGANLVAALNDPELLRIMERATSLTSFIKTLGKRAKG